MLLGIAALVGLVLYVGTYVVWDGRPLPMFLGLFLLMGGSVGFVAMAISRLVVGRKRRGGSS